MWACSIPTAAFSCGRVFHQPASANPRTAAAVAHKLRYRRVTPRRCTLCCRRVQALGPETALAWPWKQLEARMKCIMPGMAYLKLPEAHIKREYCAGLAYLKPPGRH